VNQLKDIPASRNTDPISSHIAEGDFNEGGRAKQAHIAYKVVLDHPGHTSMELEQFCELDRYQLARRLSDLERIFPPMVTQGDIRQCKISGRKAVVWYIAGQKPIKAEGEGQTIQVEYPCPTKRCGSYFRRNGVCNICHE